MTRREEMLNFGPVNIKVLRELHETRPFVPFTITLADGRKLTVPHNEFFSFFPSGRSAILTHGDESFTLIDLFMVTAVDMQKRNAARRTREAGITPPFAVIG